MSTSAGDRSPVQKLLSNEGWNRKAARFRERVGTFRRKPRCRKAGL